MSSEGSTAYHYDCRNIAVPPTYMDELFKFMEEATGKHFSITIKNVNLLESLGKDGDTINARCLKFVKITEETNEYNDETLKEVFEPTSSYWTTKKGAVILFEDEFMRNIPMTIANANIPLILKNIETGECFNTLDYNPDLKERIADKISNGHETDL